MLTFPEVFTHADGIVVFPDDEDPNLFYLLPGRPRLRTENGVPVFRALFWTDQANGTGGGVAGLMGGQLNFDTNLAVSEADREAIRRKIEETGVRQARHDAMERDDRDRRARMERAGGAPAAGGGSRVPDVGPVRFGSVRFTGGTVTLLQKVGDEFVTWASTGGPPSLMGDNNAAFAMRLGALGAAAWFKTLQQDASAVGIRYELKFEARLPSLQIHVWAGSRQRLDIERQARRAVDNMDQGCGDADVERIEVASITETLQQEGLVHIDIVKGSAKISDEHVAQLRNAALTIITDRVKEILQHRIRGMTEEERRSSLLKIVSEEVTGFAELRLTQRDVIEWAVNPQATITDFLGGLTGDARQRLVTVVDLADPVVATLEIRVSVSAPWDGTPKVTRVIVHLEYPAGGPDAVGDLSFDKSSTKQVFRWRRARHDRGDVRISAQAFLLGAADPIDVPVKRADRNQQDVHIEVAAVGAFKVKVRPSPNLFSLRGTGEITGVEVDYTYKEPGAPDHLAGSDILRPPAAGSPDDGGLVIEHTTFRAVDAPLTLRPRYLRNQAPAIEGAPQQLWMTAGTEGRATIESPWRDALAISGEAAPGIKGLKRVRVELRHADAANGFISTAEMLMDGEDGEWSASTQLVQMNAMNQRFQYRYSVYGEDQLFTSPWMDAEGDGRLPTLPILAVRVRFDRLQLGTRFTDAELRLVYREDDRGFECRHELFLTAQTPEDGAIWLIPRANATNDGFRYTLTLFPPTGPGIELPEAEGRGNTLRLQPPA